MDETDVNAEFGARVRVFSDAKSHLGGSRSSHAAGGNGRHVTLVIAASASGEICPPFIIVEGKNIMETWFQPLPTELFEDVNTPIINRLIKSGWFPRDAAIFTSESGSMNMDILRLFIRQLNNEVRKHIGPEEKFLLTLDSHASTKGIEWVKECVKISCLAVLAQGNTSHFFQPCDQYINKRFKRELRNVRDGLTHVASCDHRNIQFKLMCAVIAHERITKQDCALSFCHTGLYPFSRDFADKFKQPTVDLTGDDGVETEGVESLEANTAETAHAIVLTEKDDSRMIQRLPYLLKACETTNSVLTSHSPRMSVSSTSTSASTNRAVLPALLWNTSRWALRLRKKKIEDEKREKERKKNRKSTKGARERGIIGAQAGSARTKASGEEEA